MSFSLEDVTLAVEFAFGFEVTDTNPTWTDVTEYVETIDTERGRSALLQQFPAGTGTLVVDNSDGRFDPNNTSSPYSPNLKLGVPARIQATHSMTTYTIFRGMVEAWPLQYGPREYATATISLVDLSTLFSQDRGSVASTYPAQTTDARITAVLDDIGWDSSLRDIDSGIASVQAITVEDETALDLILGAAEVEVGEFFVASDGSATFRNRIQHAGGLTPSATFGASNIHYEEIDVDPFGEDEVFNEAKITREDGDEQTASDQTAIDDLGYTSTLEQDIGHHANDPGALNAAEWYVGKHKDTRTRIRLMFLPGVVDAWPTALGLDLRGAVRVIVDPPGGGDDLDETCALEGISHHITEDEWETTFVAKPLASIETDSYWVLGTSQLGTDTVLA